MQYIILQNYAAQTNESKRALNRDRWRFQEAESFFENGTATSVENPLVLSVFILFANFFVVSDLIPDQNHGSIADGFRKMNVLFAVMVPFSLCSWGIAFALTAVNDFSDIPRSRIMLWGVLAAAFVIVITIVCGVDL